MTNTPSITHSPPAGLPAFLTVEEAAAIVRIGRTAAYQLARQFEHTGGAQGLPVVRIGRSFRVPLARLEAWAGAPLGTDQLESTGRQVTFCSSAADERTVDLRQASPDAGNTSDRLDRRAGHGHGAAKETVHNQSQPRLPFIDEPAVALVESPTTGSISGVGEQGTDGVDTLAPGVPQPRPARSRVQVGEPRC